MNKSKLACVVHGNHLFWLKLKIHNHLYFSWLFMSTTLLQARLGEDPGTTIFTLVDFSIACYKPSAVTNIIS